MCLHRPTLLVEPAAVSQHHAAVARSIHVGVDDPPVLGRKGNALLRHREGRQGNGRYSRIKNTHAAISLVLCVTTMSPTAQPTLRPNPVHRQPQGRRAAQLGGSLGHDRAPITCDVIVSVLTLLAGAQDSGRGIGAFNPHTP